jgi:peptidoglycan hydrolase-like protein with peptidoglycan-binding domain
MEKVPPKVSSTKSECIVRDSSLVDLILPL